MIRIFFYDTTGGLRQVTEAEDDQFVHLPRDGDILTYEDDHCGVLRHGAVRVIEHDIRAGRPTEIRIIVDLHHLRTPEAPVSPAQAAPTPLRDITLLRQPIAWKAVKRPLRKRSTFERRL